MSLRLILLHGAFCGALALWAGGCGRTVEVGEVLRPEHPRPDFERAEWLNLNGNWAYHPDPDNKGLEAGWYEPRERFGGAMAVPTGWPEQEGVGWLRREAAAPRDWAGKRVWLRFEGVAGGARVWLDGEEVGGPQPGWTPFALDVTERLPPGGRAVLTVRAVGGAVPGSAWLEARPAHHIENMSLLPRQEAGRWRLDGVVETAGSGGEVRVDLTAAGTRRAAAAGPAGGRLELALELDGLAPWTPENPKLHPVELTLNGPDGAPDRVRSYVALRTLAPGDAGAVLLNGAPVYLRGAAMPAQPTAATDEDLRGRVERVKRLGFNLLQPQAPEGRLRYWADALGVLLSEPGDPITPLLIAGAAGGSAFDFKRWVNETRGREGASGYLHGSLGPDAPGYEAFVRNMGSAELQGADFVGWLGPEILEAAPGEKLPLRTFVSHFSDREDAPKLQATLVGVNDLGGEISLMANPRQARWRRSGVTEQPPLPITVPEIRKYVGAIALELLDPSGERIAANFVNIVVRDELPSPRRELLGPRRLALRLDPARPDGMTWPGSETPQGRFTATGSGRVEYLFAIQPEDLAAGIVGIELLAEAAALPDAGTVRVGLSREDLGEVELPGDPDDARGVLSRLRENPDDRYGRLLRLELKPTPELLERMRADGALRLVFESAAGLVLHGERSGLYPLDLTVILATRDAIEAPAE